MLKHYGDSSSYDVGIERDGRLVQIKSTTFRRRYCFSCNLVGAGQGLRARSRRLLGNPPRAIDYWYIIPFAAVSRTAVSLQFTPQKQGHKYECYLEAWPLLRGVPETVSAQTNCD